MMKSIGILLKLWRKVSHLLARHCLFTPLRIALYRQSGARIGRRVFIGLECYLDEYKSAQIIIEDHAHVAYRVTFIAHGPPWPSGRPIHIESTAFVGACVVILPGVRIGRGAMVGAGSVVVHDVEPWTVVVGCPARPIQSRFDKAYLVRRSERRLAI